MPRKVVKKLVKLGRPTGSGLPDEEVRTQFPLRLNDAEKEAIAAAAKRAGMPASTWARTVLLREAGR